MVTKSHEPCLTLCCISQIISLSHQDESVSLFSQMSTVFLLIFSMSTGIQQHMVMAYSGLSWWLISAYRMVSLGCKLGVVKRVMLFVCPVFSSSLSDCLLNASTLCRCVVETTSVFIITAFIDVMVITVTDCQVQKLFESYHFKLGDNSVSILEGTDEGLFCWFTVNFLHGIYA